MVFLTCTGLSPSTVGFSKTVPLQNTSLYRSPATPVMPKQNRFRLFPFRSPLLWITIVLFSCGYWDVSVPHVRLPVNWNMPINRHGLPHSGICGLIRICQYPQLIAACHVLHRLWEPRHPPYALNNFLYKNPRIDSILFTCVVVFIMIWLMYYDLTHNIFPTCQRTF